MTKRKDKSKKLVKVAPKTWIEVEKTISDEDAIKRYFERKEANIRGKGGRPSNKSKEKKNLIIEDDE